MRAKIRMSRMMMNQNLVRQNALIRHISQGHIDAGWAASVNLCTVQWWVMRSVAKYEDEDDENEIPNW